MVNTLAMEVCIARCLGKGIIDSDCCEAHLQRLVCVLQEGLA